MLGDIENTKNRIVKTKWVFTDNVAADKNIIEEFYEDNYDYKPEIIQVNFT